MVPTYSRPDQLAECLRSIARIEYPRDRFEVIVVDDGTEPPIDDVVAPLVAGLSLSLLRQSNAGPGAAQMLGSSTRGGTSLPLRTTTACRTQGG